MSKVAVCQPVELVFVDPGRLLQLSRERGARGAEVIAGIAMEEIVMRLGAAEAAWRAGEVSRLAKVARSLVGVSSEMGFATLAEVAAMVADEAPQADRATVAALVARLLRVGRNSLSAVGDLDHLRL